jgi:hypothetical protein
MSRAGPPDERIFPERDFLSALHAQFCQESPAA